MKKEIWSQQVNDIFKKETPDDYEIFLDIISIALDTTKDMSKLYHVIGLELLADIVTNFSGRTIVVPDKLEFRNMIITATCYYLKEIKGMTWDEIKNELPLQEISSIKYGKQIIKLNDKIKAEIASIFSANEGFKYEQ